MPDFTPEAEILKTSGDKWVARIEFDKENIDLVIMLLEKAGIKVVSNAY